MTLFRKVFQNQARPALRDDGLDEAALRSAFTHADADAQPVVLDPFKNTTHAEAVEDHGSQDHVVAREEDLPEQLWPGDHADEAPDTEVFDLKGDVAEDVADHLADDLDDVSIEAVTSQEDVVEQALDVQEPAYQTDEEIAACLGRAIAAKAPEPQDNELADVAANDLDTGDDAVVSTPAIDNERPFERAEKVVCEPEEKIDLAHDEALVNELSAQLLKPAPRPETEVDLSPTTGLQAVPAPAVGRAGRSVGRVKTRLLGFNRTGDVDHDPFGQAPEATATAQSEKYPVGWLVIVEGPGVGHAFSIFTGASMIGRGEDQVIRLDFGDNSISRSNHAAIAYDEEQNKFYIGHGGKSNIIRRNARPVLSTEDLNHADLIRIGETTLRFVALCGSDFQWKTAGGAHDAGI